MEIIERDYIPDLKYSDIFHPLNIIEIEIVLVSKRILVHVISWSESKVKSGQNELCRSQHIRSLQ